MTWCAVVLAVSALMVLAGLATLWAWAADRRDHRRYLADLAARWGPDGARAAGEAWRPIAGDGPPSLRVRARGITAEATDDPTPTRGEAR